MLIGSSRPACEIDMAAMQSSESNEPRRRLRFSIEALLAGLLALAIIVIILAGAFSLGRRRLAQFQTSGTSAGAPRVSRATPGLQAPPPLPQARRSERLVPAIEPPDIAAAPEPVAPAIPLAVQPPRLGIASSPAFAPAAPLTSAGRPKPSLGEFLGFVQFTKMRDAVLNRPDPLINPARLQRPQASSDLAQARAQSRLSPDAVRALLAERQALPRLSDRRSQARIDSTRVATTQPSGQ